MSRRYCRIRHLAMTLWPSRSWGKLIMASWTACFDGSGSEEDERTPFISVAGFLTTAEQWVALSELWEERLAKDGIKYFHMREFAHSVDQFTGWRDQEDRRRALLRDLVDLIKSYTFRKFGVTVRLAAMRELDVSLRDEFHLNAYALAGRSCAQDVLNWLGSEGLLTTPFALVYEKGDAGQQQLRQRLEEDGFPVNFEPKKDEVNNGIFHAAFTPLQAADILAYELSLCAIRQNVTRWAAHELMQMPGSLGVFDVEDMPDLQKKLLATKTRQP